MLFGLRGSERRCRVSFVLFARTAPPFAEMFSVSLAGMLRSEVKGIAVKQQFNPAAWDPDSASFFQNRGAV